ncbi:19863_t:CDS:2 [Cetraspora pellucida]|uniref:19863_t:CDS:1 n=1 Tax=Cetraspora pellucida TaxID=1433469 RepID=A0A9N9BNL7_9GLOM|nr:19863_t:CDS:2 [Cetraspora pellucida]
MNSGPEKSNIILRQGETQTQVNLSNDTNKSLEHSISDVELRVTVKVLGYVLVFILQWIPTIPYEIYQIYGNAPTWMYCMVAASINMGGIGNAIFYIINEGLSRNVDNCKSSLTTCQTTEQIVLNSKDINDSDSIYENVESRFSINLSKRSLDVIPDGTC